jgi:hypothetical protein
MSTGFGGGGGDGLGDLFASVRIDTSGAATGVNEVREAMQAAAGAAGQLEKAADSASSSLTRKAASARTATDSSRQLADQSRQTAHQLLQVGRIADDAQYIFSNGMGLRPIINNLIEINPLLGLATLGVDMMIRHWDKLNDVLDPDRIKVYSGALEELKKQIKDLEASKPELAVDLRQLDNARDQLEDMMRKKHAFDQLMSGRTAIEIESGKAFQEALTNAPGGPEAVEKAIRGRMAEQVVQADPKFKAKSAEMEEARQRIEEVQERMKGEDPVLRAMSQIQIAGIEHRMREVTNELGVIRENARTQAKEMTDQMLGGARLGRPKDIEKTIGWMQGIGIERPTVFAAEMARPEAVVLPEDRRKTEHAVHEIARAEEKAQRDAEAAAHGAQLKAVQDAQRATESAAHAFAMRAGGTGALAPGFTQASVAADLAAGGMAEADVKKLAEGIYARAVAIARDRVSRHAAEMGAGVGFDKALADLRARFEESERTRAEAAASKERRREAETPEQRARRQAIEKAAHRVEGGAGGLAEQLEPLVMAKIAQGLQTERILAGLGPQVARRIRGVPGVGPGLAGEVGTQVVRDVIAKSEAPIAAGMGMGAPNVQFAAQGAAGRALAHNQQVMMHAQQEAMARDVAAQFMAQGATQQQAMALGHKTVTFMGQGLNLMQAMGAAYAELIRHAGQMEQRLGRIEHQFHNTRRRANLLNRGGPAG